LEFEVLYGEHNDLEGFLFNLIALIWLSIHTYFRISTNYSSKGFSPNWRTGMFWYLSEKTTPPIKNPQSKILLNDATNPKSAFQNPKSKKFVFHQSARYLEFSSSHHHLKKSPVLGTGSAGLDANKS